jgi:hypothetical protein
MHIHVTFDIYNVIIKFDYVHDYGDISSSSSIVI